MNSLFSKRPTLLTRCLSVAAVAGFVICGSLNRAAILAADAADAAKSDFSASEQRLYDAVRYLASDELEGRGVETEGINKAADFIAKEFAAAGLKTDIIDGGPFQKFTMTVKSEPGPKEQNKLAFVGPAKEDGSPQRLELALGKTFNSLAVGGSAQFDAPVVFVGYGITSPEHEFDEYKGLDVEGKIVVMIRKEPQQDNPHSKFDGTDSSRHAFFTTKISNAFQHGAAAVVLVNDGGELKKVAEADERAWAKAVEQFGKTHEEHQAIESPTDDQTAAYRLEIKKLAERIVNLSKNLDREPDRLLDFSGAGTESSHAKMPVFFASRASVEPMVQAALGKSLDELEAAIDEDLQPRSSVLEGWTAVGEANVVHQQAEVKNIIGVLEGEGPLADETVIVGAHYDHIGMGGNNSLAPGTVAIHNGADDNASGSAALLEVARRYGSLSGKPRRRMVFLAFTGEESGLIGSGHYIGNPVFPLEKTVAMINMDMVGRLNDNKLIVHGTGTATTFDALVDELNKE
ncbi:MAG: M28 family peptidase, partial [Planctomycetales bacterium]|nr:M28 family peptidase [Planctomycetales bacterium]